MEKYDDVLPEEKDMHNQQIIENLHQAYRPEFQDDRTFARVRQRLLARDGWQEQTEDTALSYIPQQKRSDTKNPRSSNVKMHGQRVLAVIAAVLVISFLAGSWALMIHLAQRTSVGRGYGNLDAIPDAVIDIHMFNSSIGWALTRDHKTLRTTDGGVNWQEVTPPALRVLEEKFMLAGPWAFYDATTAWVAVTVNEQQTREYHSPTAELVFHTTDGGATWYESVIKLSGQSARGLIFINAHVGWLFSSPDATIQGPERDAPLNIWHTIDAGKTWTNILNSSSPSAHILNGTNAPAIIFGDEHVGLMIGQNNRLYRTSDGGTTWQLRPWPGTTDNMANSGEAYFFTAKDALFTSTTLRPSDSTGVSVVVYTTHDAGLTWHASPSFSLTASQGKQGNGNWMGGVPAFSDMQHGWVAISPDSAMTTTNKQHLLYYRTSDGGQHWALLPTSSIPNNAIADFAYSPVSYISPNIGWLIARDSKGGLILLKTVDGGHTWVKVHTHFPSFIEVSTASS